MTRTGWTPASNAEAFRSLADAGVLPAALGNELAGAVGFRNVLVHDYAEVDDVRVVANLERVAQLRVFVAEMTRLILRS